jgi:hypothetical protein
MSIFVDIFKAGTLELIVNRVINEIPSFVKILRVAEGRKYYMYKTEEDFVLGWVVGRLATKCEDILTTLHARTLQWGEYAEIGNLLNNRMAQIRNKIAETG